MIARMHLESFSDSGLDSNVSESHWALVHHNHPSDMARAYHTCHVSGRHANRIDMSRGAAGVLTHPRIRDKHLLHTCGVLFVVRRYDSRMGVSLRRSSDPLRCCLLISV